MSRLLLLNETASLRPATRRPADCSLGRRAAATAWGDPDASFRVEVEAALSAAPPAEIAALDEKRRLPYLPAPSSRPGTPPAILRALAKRDALTAAPLVTFPDSWRTRNLARRRADQDLKQLAHLQLLGEWVGQRELGLHLVAISSALSLAHHVPLVDQLGQDSVGGAFGDADGSGDVAQADTGVTSHADQDMRVIGQKVPVRSRLRRGLMHIS